MITDAERYGFTPATYTGGDGGTYYDDAEGAGEDEEEVAASQEVAAPAPARAHYDQDQVIQTLYSHFRKHGALKTPDARWPFFARIDPENAASFGVPDYFEKIEEHVNLIDIGERIAAGYPSLDQFTHDMRRMFTNVLTYFEPSTVPYQTAVALKVLFRPFCCWTGCC